jgi:hypothetical protein
MALYPEIVAGYAAARELLAGTDVAVKDPATFGTAMPTDMVELLASFPPAYSVEAVPLYEGINVIRNGRYGFTGTFTGTSEIVRYPVAHDAPDFTVRLGEALMPVIERNLADAAAEREREHAANPGGVHESSEAIREIW